MAKNPKTDYFRELAKIAENAQGNVRAFKAETHSETTADKPLQNGRLILNVIRSELQKDYFTKIEREDILMLAMLLWELCEESEKLLLTAKKINPASYSPGTRSMSEYLAKAVDNVKNMIIALSAFPKKFTPEIFFKEHTAVSAAFNQSLINEACHSFHFLTKQIDTCFSCCRKIIIYTEYTVIKNT